MDKLKLAIQKSGRLHEDSIKLLKECGIDISNGVNKLKSEALNFPLEVYFLRDDDIPQYVEDAVADIGIVGENIVYEKNKHLPADGVVPSDTDAGRMLEGYVAAELAGQANEGVRRHTKASLSLAVGLQHSRTADFRLAALCAEATSSVVNIIAIVSGRRDPAD